MTFAFSRMSVARVRGRRFGIARANFMFGAVLPMVAILSSFDGSWAQSVDQKVITPFFSAPIPTDEPPTEGRNPELGDLLRSNRGPTVLLVDDVVRAALLIGADQAGFGTLYPLPIEASGMHLAEGAGDTLWIGGVREVGVSMFSMPLSFAHLAKVDRLGHFFWQREYGGQTARSIQSIVGLPSGDIVVSGRDSDQTWLARISVDGNILWERFIGLGKGSGVTTLDGKIILAALEAFPREQKLNPPDADYREDVALWSFDLQGDLLGHRVVREGLDRVSGERAADLRLERATDGIYVFSAWFDDKDMKPLEVARVDVGLHVVWRKELPVTVQPLRRNRLDYCRPAVTSLSNGDALVACHVATTDNLQLSRFKAANGELSEYLARISAAPSDCTERWRPVRFLKEKSENAVWLFGSPPSGQGPKACGWIGEAVVPRTN